MLGGGTGGGAIRRTLRTNIKLNDFLDSRPDIFVYGEAGSPTPRGLFLPGYSYMLHPAKKKITKILGEEVWQLFITIGTFRTFHGHM